MHVETKHKVHLLNITSSRILKILKIFIEAWIWFWSVLFRIFLGVSEERNADARLGDTDSKIQEIQESQFAPAYMSGIENSVACETILWLFVSN